MWKIALRPRWIAALLLALAVAAGFALLSQWQISRSVSNGTVVERPTETTKPLEKVAQPQVPVKSDADGQKVATAGAYVPGDTVVLSDRINGGQAGYWVVAHFSTTSGAGLAVALGWTGDRANADTVASGFQKSEPASAVEETLTGRFVLDDSPQTSDFEHGKMSVLSTAALVNLWSVVDPGGVYNGYIVLDSPPPYLIAIDSPRPISDVEVNWLNIFYAAEWVIFAGFAIFLWWRLVRDVWERERASASIE